MTISDLRTKNREELLTQLAEQRKALQDLVFQAQAGSLKDTSSLRKNRHLTARILTVLREQEILAEVGKEGAP